MRYEARFSPTAEDFITGFRMHYRQSNDIWKAYILGAVGVVLVFGVVAYVMQFLGIALLGVGVGVIAIGALYLQELPIRRIAKRVTGEEVVYILSDSGVEFKSSIAHSKLDWIAFTEARLDERGIALYTGRMVFSFIPARAFGPGSYPRSEIRSLLAAKIRNA